MAVEARELEEFLNGIPGAEALAKQAGILAVGLENAEILSVKRTPRVELPKGIRTEILTIGTVSKGEIVKALGQRDIKVTPYAQYLIDRTEFSAKPQDIELVWLSGRNLGLTTGSTYREFCEAGQSRGYKLNPGEVGLYLRLQDRDQPLGNLYWIAMEPILDRYGPPSVFALVRYEDGLWLSGYWAGPTGRGGPGRELVFSLRK